MYNGVGLPTPRGSGTSGHVQRNCAALYKTKEKPRQHKDDASSGPEPLSRQPNKEILEHSRKRAIEVKCVELEDALEEQGYSQEEIDSKVQAYRQVLMENYEKSLSAETQKLETDEMGRPILRGSHQSAEAQLERNAKLRDAFGLEPSTDAT